MKFYTLAIFTFFYSCVFAQAPQGYYNDAENLSGFDLKTALHLIISENHFPQTYGSVWTFFENNDANPDGTVKDIFSDCDFEFGPPEFGGNQDVGLGGNIECEYFNREHTFPTSWFGGSNQNALFTDIHHLYPADKYVNNVRSTFVFAEVNNPTFTSQNGSKLGPSSTSGLNGTAFEIVDEIKGDIARAFFYIATRYENEIEFWVGNNPDGDKILSGNASTAYQTWALNMLYNWHLNDPVDQDEMDRNDAAFIFQGNRNPFVDHPEWICEVWNFEDSCTLSANTFEADYTFSVYPNPVENGLLFIETQTEFTNFSIYNLSGKIMLQQENKSFQNEAIQLNLSNFKPGIYLVKAEINSQNITKKIIVR